MKRPEPLKHADCECCLEPAPLLMPVGFAPGWPVIVWQRMCLSCRLGARTDRWQTMESDLMHSRNQSARAAYPEWMAAEV